VENTAARIATPNAPPSWRIALKAPDALPMSPGGTEPTTALVTAGMASPSPAPEMNSGATSAA
jgi:hypothetical protein